MVKSLSFIVMMIVVMMFAFYVNALPPGTRVRRGFNNSGYGSERGGGYFSNERDASVSHEDGEECSGQRNSGENYDSLETSYGRNYKQNENYHERLPRKAL